MSRNLIKCASLPVCCFAGFVVLPGRKWVLESGRDYEILIEIYDKDSHKIYPSEVILTILYIEKIHNSIFIKFEMNLEWHIA